jgi:hypothetical protein
MASAVVDTGSMSDDIFSSSVINSFRLAQRNSVSSTTDLLARSAA